MNLPDFDNFLSQTSNVVFDTGVFLAYFGEENENFVEILEKHIYSPTSKIKVWVHTLCLTEIYYIECRNNGVQKAKDLKSKMLRSFQHAQIENLFEIAGHIKCNFPLALSDCFSIALGINQNLTTIFMPEKELTQSIIKKINQKWKAQLKILQI